MNEKVRETLEIIIERYPYPESINSRLIQESKIDGNDNNSYFTNIRGRKLKTSDKDDAPSKTLEKWVENVVRYNYHQPDNGRPMQQRINYDTQSWFAEYPVGGYTRQHQHLPYCTYSFVYFIRTPKGSSPLVFSTSGRRIKAEAGKVVIFSAGIKHHVPKNKGEGRLVLAGNMAPILHHQETP